MSQIAFRLRQVVQGLWFLPAAFSVVAVLTVVAAYMLARLVPDELPVSMPSNAVESILTVLASSLLTVAVFALSTIVSTLASASSATTPRAVPLIVGDRSAQTSISVFIGAFLYAIVGIIGLSAGLYSDTGRLLLFVVTLVVVVLVVAALIRWIGQISAIGRVAETIDRAAAATEAAFRAAGGKGLMGCRENTGPVRGAPIHAQAIGYVQHIDLGQLDALAEEHDLKILITARPGAYAAPDRPLLRVEGVLDDDLRAALAKTCVVGAGRTFEADPRFGLIVLSEIAQKALSPGINDPGTAIRAMGSLVRILAERPKEMGPTTHERVTIDPLAPEDLVADAFRPIARDGARHIEVVLRLLSGLRTLARCRPDLESAARRMSDDATARAMAALDAASDRELLARSAAGLDSSPLPEPGGAQENLSR